jgi:hypothetical protein
VALGTHAGGSSRFRFVTLNVEPIIYLVP